MNALYEATLKLLADAMPEKALRQHLNEGLAQLGATEDTVRADQLFKVLKANVYRAMQLNLPAAAAKARVQAAINQLGRQAPDEPDDQTRQTLQGQAAALPPLEEAVRRFNFYFEWPEVQRFRSQLAVIRDEHNQGHAVPNLIRDAQAQLEALERRLQDGLARQAREIVELKAELERVRSINGPKVKRLQTLIGDIEREHAQGTLAPAEIERARRLGLDLRRLVESNVVQTGGPVNLEGAPGPEKSVEMVPTDQSDDLILETEFELEFPSQTSAVPPAVLERLKDLDLAEQARALDALAHDHPNELQARPDLAARLEALRADNAARELRELDIKALADDLQAARPRLLEHNRAALQGLKARVQALEQAGLDVRELNLGLVVAERTMDEGNPAVEDLASVDTQVGTLEQVAAQRDATRREEDARHEGALARQAAFIAATRARQRQLVNRPAQ
ncbi:MAG TPA: hypothetical protein VHN99_03010, partial [Deinococcales bacterium]|nr:hypothetical protein [Deinococcales bacterium]